LRAVSLQIASGSNHCFAVVESGAVFGWGLNNYGQLGLGHMDQVHFVAPISPLLFACERARARECVWWLLWLVVERG
jgi:alpha-tubulin suppressor-like RCC1 family protein